MGLPLSHWCWCGTQVDCRWLGCAVSGLSVERVLWLLPGLLAQEAEAQLLGLPLAHLNPSARGVSS